MKTVEGRVWGMDIKTYVFIGNFKCKWSRQKRALSIEKTKKKNVDSELGRETWEMSTKR